MEIKKRTQDLEKVFEQRWKANNYNQNGFKEMAEFRKQHFNKLFNIKDKEEQRQEILKASSVDGTVDRLEQKMKAVSNFKNNNPFR